MTLVNRAFHPFHPSPTKPPASPSEIKQWIKSIDTNNDGKISKQELQAALGHLNLWVTQFRAWWAMQKVDTNGNGCVDTPAEFQELESYAEKHWGHKINLAA